MDPWSTRMACKADPRSTPMPRDIYIYTTYEMHECASSCHNSFDCERASQPISEATLLPGGPLPAAPHPHAAGSLYTCVHRVGDVSPQSARRGERPSPRSSVASLIGCRQSLLDKAGHAGRRGVGGSPDTHMHVRTRAGGACQRNAVTSMCLHVGGAIPTLLDPPLQAMLLLQRPQRRRQCPSKRAEDPTPTPPPAVVPNPGRGA